METSFEQKSEQKMIATPSRTAELLRRHGLSAKKSLGQNFLVEQKIAEKIVAAADLQKSDFVVEIGPGLGALTQFLAQKAQNVAAVELDRRLAAVLRETLADSGNLRVIEADARKTDLDALAAEQGRDGYKLVANLPYYITTPLLMHFLENSRLWQVMVLMLQKEVAARIMAAPGGKDYGALSLAVQYHAKVEKVLTAPPAVFLPRPQVESVVIRLTPLPGKAVAVADERLLFSVIGAAFAQRRKTLLNSLCGSGLKDKPFWQSALSACGIEPARRGETLSLTEFALLAGHCHRESNP
ncbi:MAG: 16S rRNA (adenine(1518)-N(6)/adenine(1519)-N(6))-dimethyltransferase RsmA [Clostridiales bacterium]|nr:16S rRNA (adenine(1518)-N(6)/adenine(1519)-N(6))-dimethyltransferase RsmA [Clostridiales bacterium]